MAKTVREYPSETGNETGKGVVRHYETKKKVHASGFGLVALVFVAFVAGIILGAVIV